MAGARGTELATQPANYSLHPLYIIPTTTVENFQGSWSYVGLEWRALLAQTASSGGWRGGVVLIFRPSFCPSQRARSWLVQPAALNFTLL